MIELKTSIKPKKKKKRQTSPIFFHTWILAFSLHKIYFIWKKKK